MLFQDVIAVTGNARQGQIDECLASGFDDVAVSWPHQLGQGHSHCNANEFVTDQAIRVSPTNFADRKINRAAIMGDNYMWEV